MSKRIRELRLRSRLSQDQFGKKFKASREAVSQWEAGKTRPDQKKLELIAAEFNVTLDWIAGLAEDAPQQPASPSVSDTPREITPPLALSGHMVEEPDLPVYGFAAGSEEDVFFIDQGAPNVIKTARPRILKDIHDAYAVDVFGDSMAEKYEPGNRLWVHPRRPVKPGDDVVIQFHDGRAMVKRLVRRTADLVIVQQFNPPKELRFKKSEVKSLDLVVGMLTVLT